MHKNVEKLDRDFHKVLMLLGSMAGGKLYIRYPTGSEESLRD
jgi:hypothetical protein